VYPTFSFGPRFRRAAGVLLLLGGAGFGCADAPPPAGTAVTFVTADGRHSVKIGGRIQWDTDTFDGALNRSHDGGMRFNSQLRRARLELSGTLYEDFAWVSDVNINDDPSAKSAEFHAVGLRYTGFRAFDIFIGRDKEPFGLEELMSSKAITTIERNYFTEATDADSQPHYGVRLDGMAGPVGWSAALFNPTGSPKRRDGGDRFAFTGRVFGAPIDAPGHVLHLGIGYTDRNLDRPQSQHGFRLDIAEAGGELDSSALVIDDDRQTGLELLYIRGPWSFQSEAFRKDMHGAPGEPDGRVDHYYLQASWAVTGESRAYRKRQGITDMLKPGGHRGAVELVAKYDWIRFDADGRPDETVNGYLAGVNWYVNPYVKLMLNYIRVTSSNVVLPGEDRDANVVSTRIQVAI
jgi:phosphate-selective porin OprO and OprP